MNKERYIKIRKGLFEKIFEEYKLLQFMKGGGVDNWEWIGEVYEQFDEYIDSGEFKKELDKIYEEI